MRFTTLRVIFSTFTACSTFGALANPPTHLCDGNEVKISKSPMLIVEGGKLVQLLSRKLKQPVAYKPDSYREIDLLPGPTDLFPYPGELEISEKSGMMRIVHNHHVLSDGTYSASANGWWVIEVEPSGKAKAIGFNTKVCFFRSVYDPNK